MPLSTSCSNRDLHFSTLFVRRSVMLFYALNYLCSIFDSSDKKKVKKTSNSSSKQTKLTEWGEGISPVEIVAPHEVSLWKRQRGGPWRRGRCRRLGACLRSVRQGAQHGLQRTGHCVRQGAQRGCSGPAICEAQGAAWLQRTGHLCPAEGAAWLQRAPPSVTHWVQRGCSGPGHPRPHFACPPMFSGRGVAVADLALVLWFLHSPALLFAPW